MDAHHEDTPSPEPRGSTAAAGGRAGVGPGTTTGRPTLPWRPLAGLGAAALLIVLALVLINADPSDPVVAAPPPARPGTTSTTTAPTTTMAPTTTTAAPVETVGTTTTTRAPRNPHTGPPGPLTGSPVERPGYEQRPALVVKVDNYDPGARPQAGLTLADVVYEEKVEGPVSRFAAVFHGSDAEVVGPVRSARSTDVAIVGALNTPLFAYSGANGGFQALLARSPLVDVGAGARSGAYYRGGDKVIPHNLYSSTGALYRSGGAGTPAPLFDFRGADDPAGPGARAATGASYHFGGGTAVRWTWDTDEGGWVRTQNGTVHLDTGNWPVTVQNLIIEYVPYAASGSHDTFGNPIPEAQMHGEGRGWVLTGGSAIPVVWSKFTLDSRTGYYGPDGALVRFAPGRTWVALVPVELGATVSFADGTVGA